MALVNSVGIPVDPASLDRILDKTEFAKSKVRDAVQTVDSVRNALAGKDDDEPSRLARITKLVVRTVATLSELDTWLENTASAFTDLRNYARESWDQANNQMTWGSIVCWIILVWMAIGQAALCVLGVGAVHQT